MGMIAMLGSVAVAILIVCIVFMLAPTIGGTIENAQPALAADSNWNASYNTDIPTGAGIWTQTSPMVVVLIFVILAGIIFLVLRGVL